MEQRLVSQRGRSERVAHRKNCGRTLIVGNRAKLRVQQGHQAPGHDVRAVIEETSDLALFETAADPPAQQVNKLRGHVIGVLAVAQPELARALDHVRTK